MTSAVVLFSLLFVVASSTPLENLSNACGYPNNTEHEIKVFSCDESLPIQVLSAVILDSSTNKTVYPVDFKKPLLIKLKSHNKGDKVISNLNDVDLAQWSKSWNSRQCKWNNLPTFGLLHGIDGCDFAKNCPLDSGDLDLLLPLNLSKFGRIIKLLAGDRSYQLTIKMKDKANPQKKLSCVVVQLRFA